MNGMAVLLPSRCSFFNRGEHCTTATCVPLIPYSVSFRNCLLIQKHTEQGEKDESSQNHGQCAMVCLQPYSSHGSAYPIRSHGIPGKDR